MDIKTEWLFNAVRNGKTGTARSMLFNGVNVNSKDKYSCTPLHEAAKYGFTEIFKMLLDAGADVNAKTIHGSTPLYEAVKSYYCKEEIVESLLVAQAYTNLIVQGKTVLYEAVSSCNAKILKLLLESGVDVNLKGSTGKIPLHKAAEIGSREKVKLLLEFGADVNQKDDYKKTPLHEAVNASRKVTILKLMLQAGAEVNVTDMYGNTPLHDAARLQDSKFVELLVDADADVNIKDEYGYTPLHYAVCSRNFDSVKILLSAGANINAKDIYGETVLHFVAAKNFDKIIQYLLSRGVDVNAKDGLDQKTLHIVAKESRGRSFLNMARLLLKNGANMHAQNNECITPLQILEKNPLSSTEILELFSKHKLKVNVKDVNQNKSDFKVKFIKKGKINDVKYKTRVSRNENNEAVEENHSSGKINLKIGTDEIRTGSLESRVEISTETVTFLLLFFLAFLLSIHKRFLKK